jgi:hypothetical protein
MLGAIALYDTIQAFTKSRGGSRIQTNLILYCDNEALVNNVNRLRRKPITTKFFYTTDADIVYEILTLLKTIQQSGEQVTIKHVKGHQDRGRTALNHAARLNIEADYQASRSLDLPRTQKIDLVHTNATLFINNLPVTSNHTKVLREAYQLLALREHYNNITDWESTTFDTVWWIPHGLALSMLAPEQTTMQKFLQNRLPCNKKQHLYYGYIADTCMTCGDLETQIHIYRCESCEVRSSLRKKYLQDLRFYLENSRLNYTTTRVIVMSLSANLEGYDPLDLEEMAPDASELLRLAFEEQDEIGWSQWFKGRLSSKWGEIYAQDLSNTNHSILHQTSEKWGKKLIYDAFQFVLSAWTIRNDIEHGSNDDPMATKKSKIVAKILWQKERIDYFPNRYLENLSEDDLLKLPMDNLVMTERQIEILVCASKRKACVPRDTSVE